MNNLASVCLTFADGSTQVFPAPVAPPQPIVSENEDRSEPAAAAEVAEATPDQSELLAMAMRTTLETAPEPAKEPEPADPEPVEPAAVEVAEPAEPAEPLQATPETEAATTVPNRIPSALVMAQEVMARRNAEPAEPAEPAAISETVQPGPAAEPTGRERRQQLVQSISAKYRQRFSARKLATYSLDVLVHINKHGTLPVVQNLYGCDPHGGSPIQPVLKY